jgi:hypothetical protein
VEGLALFAQAGMAASIAHWIVILIVVGGIIGIGFIIIRQAGINIPPFVIQIFWIVLACVVGVIAIKFLAGYL